VSVTEELGLDRIVVIIDRIVKNLKLLGEKSEQDQQRVANECAPATHIMPGSRVT
jgi:hypothetical protein